VPGNKRLEELLSKPMDRREFLRNVGLLILAVIGISNAIHILSGGRMTPKNSTNQAGRGYGSGKYGV